MYVCRYVCMWRALDLDQEVGTELDLDPAINIDLDTDIIGEADLGQDTHELTNSD